MADALTVMLKVLTRMPLIFHETVYHPVCTTGENAFSENALSNWPRHTETKIEYCPNCGESWKGIINKKHYECWGCGGKIQKIDTGLLDERLLNHVLTLI